MKTISHQKKQTEFEKKKKKKLKAEDWKFQIKKHSWATGSKMMSEAVLTVW